MLNIAETGFRVHLVDIEGVFVALQCHRLPVAVRRRQRSGKRQASEFRGYRISLVPFEVLDVDRQFPLLQRKVRDLDILVYHFLVRVIFDSHRHRGRGGAVQFRTDLLNDALGELQRKRLAAVHRRPLIRFIVDIVVRLRILGIGPHDLCGESGFRIRLQRIHPVHLAPFDLDGARRRPLQEHVPIHIFHRYREAILECQRQKHEPKLRGVLFRRTDLDGFCALQAHFLAHFSRIHNPGSSVLVGQRQHLAGNLLAVRTLDSNLGYFHASEQLEDQITAHVLEKHIFTGSRHTDHRIRLRIESFLRIILFGRNGHPKSAILIFGFRVIRISAVHHREFLTQPKARNIREDSA